MKRVIDYREAAERLLNILAARATEQKPLTAIELVYMIFDPEVHDAWKDDESRRRRVRDAAVEARKLLKERRQDFFTAPASPAAGTENPNAGGGRVGLVADGRGYWLSVDPGVLSWYAQRRSDAGKQNFAAAGNAKSTAAAVHQPSLFAAPPAPRRMR